MDISISGGRGRYRRRSGSSAHTATSAAFSGLAHRSVSWLSLVDRSLSRMKIQETSRSSSPTRLPAIRVRRSSTDTRSTRQHDSTDCGESATFTSFASAVLMHSRVHRICVRGFRLRRFSAKARRFCAVRRPTGSGRLTSTPGWRRRFLTPQWTSPEKDVAAKTEDGTEFSCTVAGRSI